jgi:hypothetical protein
MADFSLIIENIKKQIMNDGYVVEVCFGKASEDELKYLTELYNTFNYFTTIYLDDELEILKDYRVPDVVLDFYRNYEPKEIPMLPCYLRLLSLDAIKEENAELHPSAYLIRYGLITFATTVGGNAVCMDLNQLNDGEPRILYCDKTYIHSDDEEIEFRKTISTLPEIAPKFSEFLHGLSVGMYEDIEDFYIPPNYDEVEI